MQGAIGSLPDRSFLCVVADQRPEYCDKSFPTIEKHNEHLKRCHSLVFYCEKCLFKFNSSLPEKNLGYAKKQHEQECKYEPSPENLKARKDHWLMDSDQYHRFKVVGWRNTPVPNLIFINGEKESLSKRSWRRIRETIFPGSEEPVIEPHAGPAASDQTIEAVMAMVERRMSVMPQHPNIREPSTDPRQRLKLVHIAPSTTDISQPSAQFSCESDSLTHPSSYVLSHSGADGHQETYGAEYGNTKDPADSFSWVLEEYQGPQPSESLSGTGSWVIPPLPPQVLMDCGPGNPPQAPDQE
ncbi:hypothetical protein FPOAC1_011704 [Fusarium poae]|jgi:hypothetical protein|uniref:hypothetical protein n=1 Tax=Fusarium poae TaxID=36050 RepID=UPI001CEA9610|nr:hypothetical protein FPOAC1_011704 [Fusarium poae]KAG8666882.1 hypothetical protein FPOAC1_011704 [Fusarium poae]